MVSVALSLPGSSSIFLTASSSFLSMAGAASLLIEVLLGVPQGSILGPFLFLLYINDLPLSSKLFTLLFGDDTTLLCSDNNVVSLCEKFNTEFGKVCEFFRINKLALHPDKTKVLFFSTSSKGEGVDIFCNNNNHGQVDPALIKKIVRITDKSPILAVRLLGVIFQPKS